MEEALRALLLDDAGVAALAGSRVTWGSRPQGSPLPAVVLYLVGGAKGYSLNGEAGPKSPRVQVNCLGESYLSAVDLERAVEALLSGFAGNYGDVYFQGILQDSEPSDLAPPDANLEPPVFGITTDFIVNHA